MFSNYIILLDKRLLSSGTEESEDRYPITRRKNRGTRNSESSSEGERNTAGGNASSSDTEGNE